MNFTLIERIPPSESGVVTMLGDQSEECQKQFGALFGTNDVVTEVASDVH